MHRTTDDDDAAPPQVPKRMPSRPVSEVEDVSDEVAAPTVDEGTPLESEVASPAKETESSDHIEANNAPVNNVKQSPDPPADEVAASDGVEESADDAALDTSSVTDAASDAASEDTSEKKVGPIPSTAADTVADQKTLSMANGSPLVARKKMDDESVVGSVALSMASSDLDEKAKLKAAMEKDMTSSQRRFFPGAHQIGGRPSAEEEDVTIEERGEQPSLVAAGVTPIAAKVVEPEPDVEAQTQNIEKRVREELMNSAVAAEIVDVSEFSEACSQEEEDKSKKHRMWIILAIILLLAIGGGVAAAVVLTGGGDDDNSKANADKSPPDLSAVGPTSSPVTLKPTMSPTVFVPPCTLCLDGSEPENLEAEVRRGFTCGDLQINLAELASPADQTCKSGQATAWLFCGCPTLPPSPFNPVCSATCPEDSRPPAFDSERCLNFESYVEIVGLEPDDCAGLIDMAPEECRCSERIPMIRAIVSSISDGKDLFETGTPQYMALEWLGNQDPANLTIGDNTPTRVWENRYFGALLWFSFNGENWIDQFDFLSVLDVCEWNDGEFGIFCDDNGRSIFDVNFVDNKLAGKFPVEFTKFTGLTRIGLPSNVVTGVIPDRIGDLSALTLFEMDFNPGFGGFLPSSLFQLPLLTRLWMDECNILGSLPDNVGDAVKLTSLSMARSGLSGPIPTSLSQMTALQTLFLNQNVLTGTLPALNNSASIFRIVLFDNLFEGTVPDHYGQLVNLERLLVDQNALTGTIPLFSGTPLIRFLYLYKNQLSGSIEKVFTTTPTEFLVEVALDINQLTGSIPTEVGSFPLLDGLWLYQNDLSGTLPSEIGQLTQMTKTLEFDENNLNGTLPTEIALLTNLAFFDVGTNELTGSIPSEYGQMTALSLLDLQFNRITATIPTSLGLLTLLTGLDLGNMELDGTLPSELGLLTVLTFLDLNGNSFNGTIPREYGNMVALERISFAANELSGTLPTELAAIQFLDLIFLHLNDLTGDLNPFFCERMDEIDTFRSDCFGDSPEVLCDCCSDCCDDTTLLCTAQ